MRKMKYFKCPECGMKFTALNGWSKHIKRDHPGLKPKDMTDMQYLYYTVTGRTHGNCIQCHGETSWNETNGKYNRFCNNPNCKAEYTKMAKQRMVDKYGKQHLLNDPDMQRKMLKGKHISGTYKFSNNSGTVDYVGTYERDFLYIMDHLMGFNAGDIMGPSPHNYIYTYEGKARVYIPDFYIPNYNLEIEIKTDENMHHKIQAVDKVKEHLKDEMMSHNPSVNYFKIMDKKYDDFFKYLLDKKFDIDEMAMENVNKYLSGATEDVTPEITEDEPANEGVLGALFIGSLLFMPICVGISLVVLNIQGAINKMKNNKIIKKYPGIDTRAEKCVNDINKLVYSCLKNRLEDNSYFKSKEFRQYETTEHKPESDGYYESTFNVDEGANTISIKYDNHASLPTITVKYPSSEDDSTSSKNYNKIAQPVFDKVDKEFASLMKTVNKDILSEISNIEKKYDCTIKIKTSGSCPHIDGYMEGGYDYNNMRADSKISCQISFNV